MVSLDRLREAVNPGLVLAVDSATGETVLTEKDTSSSLRKIVLSGLSSETVVLHMDKTKVDSIFQGGRGQCRRCDYAVFTDFRGAPLLLFIEMKSTHAGDYGKQFQGAECLVEYMDSVLKRFYGEDSLLVGRERKRVLFYRASLNKMTTNPLNANKEMWDGQALLYPLDVQENETPQLTIKEIVSLFPQSNQS